MHDNLFKKGDTVRIKNVIGMNIEPDLVSEIIDAIGVITLVKHHNSANETHYSVETSDLSGVPVEVFACGYNLELVQYPPSKIARSIFSLGGNVVKVLRSFFKRYLVSNKSEVSGMIY